MRRAFPWLVLSLCLPILLFITTDTITRCFEIMHNRLSELSRNDADVTIEVQLEKGGLREFDRLQEFARAGHDATVAALPEIAEVLPYVKEAVG